MGSLEKIALNNNWRIGESVSEWLERNLNVSKGLRNSHKECLIKVYEFNSTTLYRLLNGDLYFISTEKLRNKLADIPLFHDESIKLGLFGYPANAHIRSIIRSELRTVSLKENNQTIQTQKLFEQTKKQLLERKQLDLKTIVESIPVSSGKCFFQHRCTQFKPYQKKQEQILGVKFYLTSHTQKLFGAIRPTDSHHFETEFFTCKKCIDKYSHIFVEDISKIIKETEKKYKLKQSAIARRVKVNQGYISKIINDGVNFLQPELMKNFYRLWLKGTLKDEPLIAEHYQDYIGLMVRFVVGELDEQELLLELGMEEALSYAMDYEDLSLGQHDGDIVIITQILLDPYDYEFSTNDIKMSICVEGIVEKDSGYPHFENEGYDINANFKVTLIDLHDDTFWEFEPAPD